MFCAKCGKELPEGAKVCPNCGEKIEKDITFADVKAYAGQKAQQAAVTIQDKAKQASASVQSKYQEFKEEQKERVAEEKRKETLFYQSQMMQNSQAGQGDVPVNMPMNMYSNMPIQIPAEYKPISMWGYFGYQLLFMIPLIGFILLLVFALGGTQNKNLKNYARSYFCTAILVVFVIIMIVLIKAASR